MNKTQCDNELGAIRTSKNSLLRGFSVLNNIPFENLAVEFISEWRGRYGFIPSILVYNRGIIASAMIPKKAYDYIRYGMFYHADITIPVKGV